MVICGKFSRAFRVVCQPATISCTCSIEVPAPTEASSPRSMPEQKARPWPVRITTRAAEFRISSTACANSSISSTLRLLSFCGRLRARVVISSRFSIRMYFMLFFTQLQDGHKGFLGDVHGAELLHALFAGFLFFEE